MKQRLLAFFLILCLCLPLAACGKKQGYDPLEGVETRVITDSAGRQVGGSQRLHGPDDPHAHCL